MTEPTYAFVASTVADFLNHLAAKVYRDLTMNLDVEKTYDLGATCFWHQHRPPRARLDGTSEKDNVYVIHDSQIFFIMSWTKSSI